MLNISKMLPCHSEKVFSMAINFFQGPALSHPVPENIIRQTLNEAVSENSMLEGYILKENENIIGFAYITKYFSTEIGGICVLLEDICISEKYRGKGYGNEFFKWFFNEYSFAKRFRLEVTNENISATKLYKKLGFKFIEYNQMAIDL